MTHTILDRRGEGASPFRPSAEAHLLIDRRAALKSVFGAIGAYAVVASGVTWLVGPGRAWAMEFESFDADTADTLLHMTQSTLSP